MKTIQKKARRVYLLQKVAKDAENKGTNLSLWGPMAMAGGQKPYDFTNNYAPGTFGHDMKEVGNTIVRGLYDTGDALKRWGKAVWDPVANAAKGIGAWSAAQARDTAAYYSGTGVKPDYNIKTAPLTQTEIDNASKAQGRLTRAEIKAQAAKDRAAQAKFYSYTDPVTGKVKAPSWKEWNENQDADYQDWIQSRDENGNPMYTKFADPEEARDAFWAQFRAGRDKKDFVTPAGGYDSPDAVPHEGDTPTFENNIVRTIEPYDPVKAEEETARVQAEMDAQAQAAQTAWQNGDADFYLKHPEAAKQYGFDSQEAWQAELDNRAAQEQESMRLGHRQQRSADWDNYHNEYTEKIKALDPHSPTYIDDYNALWADYQDKWNAYQQDLQSIDNGTWGDVIDPTSPEYTGDLEGVHTPTTGREGLGLAPSAKPVESTETQSAPGMIEGVGLRPTIDLSQMEPEAYPNEQWYKTLPPEYASLYVQKLQTLGPERARKVIEKSMSQGTDSYYANLSPVAKKIYDRSMKMHGDSEVARAMVERYMRRKAKRV